MKWTNDEIKLLKQFGNKCSKEELCNIFPYRTWSSIETKIYKMDIQRSLGIRNINYDYIKNLEKSYEV